MALTPNIGIQTKIDLDIFSNDNDNWSWYGEASIRSILHCNSFDGFAFHVR